MGNFNFCIPLRLASAFRGGGLLMRLSIRRPRLTGRNLMAGVVMARQRPSNVRIVIATAGGLGGAGQ